jgi:hypothetical protein
VVLLAASASTAAAAAPPCSFQLAFKAKSGLCSADGSTAYFAALPRSLRIKTLSAKLVGWHHAPQLASTAGAVVAHGVFLVVRMQLTNESSAPVRFRGSQVELVIAENTYVESANAEAGADEQSLVFKDSSGSGLAPRKAETGDLVFDVPSSAITDFGKGEAVLALGDYGRNILSGLPDGVGLLYF